MSVKEYEGEFTPAATCDEPEPAAHAYTYEEWKAEIFKLYPGSESRDRYTRNNLEKLIADFLSKGTPSRASFSQYHREFQKIVKWLADNGKMEQSSEKEKFQRRIPSTLWVRIAQHLEILYPLHHPNDPYEVEDMFNAGDWYLKGNTTTMASIPPNSHQGGILPAPLSQPTTAPVNAKTTNTSGSDSGKNRDNKVVLLSGDYIPQYSEKLYYKDRLEEWHHLNPGNLATGNLSANAAPDAQQQQAMNNMQVPAAATLVHEIVQEPRVDQYVLTTDERIKYHQQELLKLQMLRRGNKRQVADGVQVPLPKQPLTDYHPVDTPESPPSANTEAGPSHRKESKNAKEKLLPKDKGKKPMKPTVEENATTTDRCQDGAYKTLAPAATKEQEWTIKAFNTIWDHNITMTVGGALAILQPLRNHFREMVTPKRITNANMVTISEIPDDGTDDALPFSGKSPPGTSTNHSNANSLSASVMELKGTVGAVDPVEAFYSHWPSEHHTSLCVADSLLSRLDVC
ncbi:hypothetical protein C0995_006309 [Termitomyces sp. Mi166|nr:hypothetical protein C0995_006309 [Termitomyces sp. Mi166\